MTEISDDVAYWKRACADAERWCRMREEERDALQRERDRLATEVDRLRELAIEMQSYVPDYFVHKWDLTVERILKGGVRRE